MEGGPLSVNPVAEPIAICKGDTAQLFALAGGGSGLYTYSWSSVVPGFTSSIMNPYIVPISTTTYNLVVNDGFNQLNGSTSVTVYPLPVIRLGPQDTSLCIFDSLRLDAGNEGSTYRWSTGSTNRYITATTTGIGFDIQTYSVEVTNENGCKNSGTINITYTFDDCVGIPELKEGIDFILAPNPADQQCRLIMKKGTLNSVSLFNTMGIIVYRKDFGLQKNTDYQINTGNFPAGLYLMRVSSGNRTGTVKLVIR